MSGSATGAAPPVAAAGASGAPAGEAAGLMPAGAAAVLPKLAYVGDVPADRSTAGGLLLHRLLAAYDPERLLVVTGNIVPSDPDRRLPGVTHQLIRYAPRRVLDSRFSPWAAACLVRGTPLLAAPLARRLRDWGAEAVLTVPHFYLWRAAAAAARRLDVPLHLIVHDDWPAVTPGPPVARRAYGRIFGRVYRRAAGRLCVSPYMAAYYRDAYGAAGEVLYPTRGDDSPEPRVRVRPDPGGPPVVAYAGGLHNQGYLDLVKRMAGLLASAGGRLDLYTPSTAAEIEAAGLGGPAVRPAGFLPAGEMARRVAETAHVLFSPGSFLPAESHVMRMLFPSKLADYTAIGLPVLVWAPEDSSAVRWARDNPGAAAVVTDPGGRGVLDAVRRLAADPSYARSVAAAGVAAGDRDFSLAAGRSRLAAALRSVRSAARRPTPQGRAT